MDSIINNKELNSLTHTEFIKDVLNGLNTDLRFFKTVCKSQHNYWREGRELIQIQNYKFKLKMISIINKEIEKIPLLIPVKNIPLHKKFELEKIEEKIIFFSIEELNEKIKCLLDLDKLKYKFSYFKENYEIIKFEKDFLVNNDKIIFCKILKVESYINREKRGIYQTTKNSLPNKRKSKTFAIIQYLEDERGNSYRPVNTLPVNLTTESIFFHETKQFYDSLVLNTDDGIRNTYNELKIKTSLLNEYFVPDAGSNYEHEVVKTEPFANAYKRKMETRNKVKKTDCKNKINFKSLDFELVKSNKIQKKVNFLSVDEETKNKNNIDKLRKDLIKKLGIRESFPLLKESKRESQPEKIIISNDENLPLLETKISTEENVIIQNDFNLFKLHEDIVTLITKIKNENPFFSRKNLIFPCMNLLLLNDDPHLEPRHLLLLNKSFLFYCYLSNFTQGKINSFFLMENFSCDSKNNQLINYFIDLKEELVRIEKDSGPFIEYIKYVSDSIRDGSFLLIDSFFFNMFIVPKKVSERTHSVLNFLIKIFEDENKGHFIGFEAFVKFKSVFLYKSTKEKLLLIRKIIRTILKCEDYYLIEMKKALNVNEKMITKILLVDIDSISSLSEQILTEIDKIFSRILFYLE